MDVPTRPGDVLSQPTRARLFALLGELRRPATTEELAERLELHPNGVRVHLDRLCTAGLVSRGRRRQARGRPRDVWSISPDAQPGGDPPTGYAELGRWLVRAMASSHTDLEDIEEAGRQIGRELPAPAGDSTPEERFQAALSALGFQPRREPGEDGAVTYCLDNCPYREAVHERQPIVCGLHRGMTQGMLDAIDPDTTLEAFVAKDPDTAGCLIELRGPLTSPDPPGEADAQKPAA